MPEMRPRFSTAAWIGYKGVLPQQGTEMTKKRPRKKPPADPTNPPTESAWRWLRDFTDHTKLVLSEYVDEFTKRSQDPPSTPIVRNKVVRQLGDFSRRLTKLLDEFDKGCLEFGHGGAHSGPPGLGKFNDAFDTLRDGGFRDSLLKIRDEISQQRIKAAGPLSPDMEKTFWTSVTEFIPAVRTMIEACRRAMQYADALHRSTARTLSPTALKLLKTGWELLGEIISSMETCMDIASPHPAVREDSMVRGLVHPSAAEKIASLGESIELYLNKLSRQLKELGGWIEEAEAAGITIKGTELEDIRKILRSHLALDATVFTATTQLIGIAFRFPQPAAVEAGQLRGLIDRVCGAQLKALSSMHPMAKLEDETGGAVATKAQPPIKPFKDLDKKEKLVIEYFSAHPSIPAYTVQDLVGPLADLADGAGIRMAGGTLRTTLKRLVAAGWVACPETDRNAELNSPPYLYYLSAAAKAAYPTKSVLPTPA